MVRKAGAGGMRDQGFCAKCEVTRIDIHSCVRRSNRYRTFHREYMRRWRSLRKVESLLKVSFKQGKRADKTVVICASLRYIGRMTKTHAISIRFDPELRAELEKIAARENRKLSNLVETVLRQYVEAQKRKGRKDE
jgi:hypothetical protein